MRSVESMGLAPLFFEFLSLEHSNNNVHNIRLCRQIIAAGSMPASELAALQVAEKVGGQLLALCGSVRFPSRLLSPHALSPTLVSC